MIKQIFNQIRLYIFTKRIILYINQYTNLKLIFHYLFRHADKVYFNIEEENFSQEKVQKNLDAVFYKK